MNTLTMILGASNYFCPLYIFVGDPFDANVHRVPGGGYPQGPAGLLNKLSALIWTPVGMAGMKIGVVSLVSKIYQ